MFDQKPLEVYEDDQQLYIEHDHKSFAGYPLLFFALIWNLFLVFFYSGLIASGAPLIAFLFPLLHVAAGIGIGHQALTMLFNKTKIIVADGYLSIEHSPIPAFTGNKTYYTHEIDQIYTKEKSGSKGSIYYQLRAKLANGKDVKLFSDQNLDRSRAHELEQLIEEHIGITNAPVKGEHPRPHVKTYGRQTFRRDELPEDISDIYLLRPKQEIFINGSPTNTTHVSQYDWNDGNTDKIIQLFDDNHKEQYLYIHQNQGIYKIGLEREMNVLETQDLNFYPYLAPQKLEIGDTVYLLSDAKKGRTFTSADGPPIEGTKSWTYLSLDEQSYIRIIQTKGIIRWHQGKRIPPHQINTRPGLDLNQQADPLKRNNYDEEDLV